MNRVKYILVILLTVASGTACKSVGGSDLYDDPKEVVSKETAYDVAATVEEAYATGNKGTVTSGLTGERVTYPTSDAGQAFGDQRVIFPYDKDLKKTKAKSSRQLKEVVRTLQAYGYIRELIWARKTVPEERREALTDQKISEWSGSGVVDLQELGNNHYAVKVGQGNSNNSTKRKMVQWLTAYAATADFGDIETIESYELVGKDALEPTAESLARRFGVSEKVAAKALANISAIRNAATTNTAVAMMLPFWNWEEASYSKTYKKIIKQITGGLLTQVAEMNSPNFGQVAELFRDWAITTHIDAKIEEYLRPEKRIPKNSRPERYPVAPGAKFDPNTFDKGIEFSASFSIVTTSNFTEEDSRENGQWLESKIKLTTEEREEALRNYGRELAKRLGSKNLEPVKAKSAGGHGHGLELAYEIWDSKGRKWRVEWDGIGRGYDRQGNIIPGSEYGGHMELVTPKFIPTFEDYNAVFASMKVTGMTPRLNTGGGHHNIDLAIFDGNPRAMAKFLALYLKHQGILTFLLQSEKRLWAAESVDITREFAKRLGDYRGTETRLKQELYINRFFNTRVGRKARYIGMDISAYIQSIIPEEYISADYDIKSPKVKWRPSFNVNPKILKAEVRAVDAPRTPFEAVLHDLIFKGLVNAALNDPSPVVGDPLQKVDHRFHAQNPNVALERLNEFAKTIGLDVSLLKPLLFERINITQDNLIRDGYTPIEERLASYPRQPGLFGSPLAKPREGEQQLNSADRPYEELTFKPPMSEGADRAARDGKNRADSADVSREKLANPKKGDRGVDMVIGTSPALDVPANWCATLKRLADEDLAK